MTSDDLSRPLGTARPRKSRTFPSLARPIAWASALVLAGVGVWIVVADDPLGGEPEAVATIVRRTPAAAAAPEAQPESGVKVTELGTAAPETAHNGSGVVIRPAEPGEERAPETPGSGPMIIRVPGSPGSGAGVKEPDPRLSEQVGGLVLPRIGSDGTRPMTAYARPTAGMLDARPKVAVLIGGLGISENATNEAIAKLPPDITLGFAPYGGDLERWAGRARGDGHEYVLQLPMEPFDYPNNDPGPQTLLTSEPDAVNLERLRWLLGRMRGYVGVANFMGARFTSSETSLAPVLTELGRRGLLFVDDGGSPRSLVEQSASKAGATAARASTILDSQATTTDIDAALARLEETARRDGMAIGVGSAYPVTVERVAAWAKGLADRGLVLVPVSAIVTRPKSS
jgi:polysaccharide deacetylase 2 family uncharacterized protein YibQ